VTGPGLSALAGCSLSLSLEVAPLKSEADYARTRHLTTTGRGPMGEEKETAQVPVASVRRAWAERSATRVA